MSKGAGHGREKSGKWMYIVLPVLAVLVIAIGAGWLLVGHKDAGASSPEIQLAPVSQLTGSVATAPQVVQEAYRFAIANPKILNRIPCYCGCGRMGHKSNLECFVKNFNDDGSIELDDHALGCSICVDIARDTLRLAREGKPLGEIRAYIDHQYGKFGAPTDTEPVS